MVRLLFSLGLFDACCLLFDIVTTTITTTITTVRTISTIVVIVVITTITTIPTIMTNEQPTNNKNKNKEATKQQS